MVIVLVPSNRQNNNLASSDSLDKDASMLSYDKYKDVHIMDIDYK